MAKADFMTVRIEGHPLSGVELLPDVLRQLNAMVQLLKEFAADPRYSKVQVLSIEKNSPLVAKIRTVNVVDSAIRKNQPSKKLVRPTTQPVRRLEKTYASVVGPRKSGTVDVGGMQALSDCAKLLKNDVATIETSKQKMIIDSSIIAQVQDRLGPVIKSFGSVTGVLESLNVHNKPWNFAIYPTDHYPAKIRCDFDEELLAVVQSSIRQVVTVRGYKDFVADSQWPLRVKAESILVREPALEGAWIHLLDTMDGIWDAADEEDRQFLLEELSA